jgi:hypothetical protein
MSDVSSIVIDDPVSSLDHARSILVAKRLAKEAMKRQVIVFTHSLVFHHHLAEAAEEFGIEPTCLAIFRTHEATGLVDPGGSSWGGRNVKSRIRIIGSDFDRIKKLANTSPADYERETKGLYGRMRDCWERMIEEKLFEGVISRFAPDIQTKKLRYVHVGDELVERITKGMTRTSTYSHDNPLAGTSPIPAPDQVRADIDELLAAIEEIDVSNKATEKRRA